MKLDPSQTASPPQYPSRRSLHFHLKKWLKKAGCVTSASLFVALMGCHMATGRQIDDVDDADTPPVVDGDAESSPDPITECEPEHRMPGFMEPASVFTCSESPPGPEDSVEIPSFLAAGQTCTPSSWARFEVVDRAYFVLMLDSFGQNLSLNLSAVTGEEIVTVSSSEPCYQFWLESGHYFIEAVNNSPDDDSEQNFYFTLEAIDATEK